MRLLLLSLAPILMFTACNSEPLDVDISDIDIEIEMKRFDQDLFNQQSGIEYHIANLRQEYGEFYKNYTQLLPPLGHPDDPAHKMYLKPFIEDPSVLEVNAEIQKKYGSVKGVEEEFELAWRYYAYHFPSRVIPEMIAYNSALNMSPLVNDEQMGVGLDLFLGADYPLYASVQFPLFMRRKMKRENLVYNSVKGWIISEFPRPDDQKTLLDHMVYAGKILYAMDAVFPKGPDSLKIEYSRAQLEWAKRFEGNVWGLFLDKGILFSSDRKEIGPFLNDGPFSSGLAKESPPRIGEFIGWQMVRGYMDKNSDVSLEELFALSDSQALMQQSGYRPK